MLDNPQTNTVYFSSSPEETMGIGKTIASTLSAGDIVCMQGDLGAGKTTLAKGIISFLTHTPLEEIQSPTFVLLNLYTSSKAPVCHFDLYRMDREKAFVQRGFLDYFDNHHLCLIEWPSKIPSFIPPYALHITISHEGTLHRMITCKRGA